MSPTNHEINSQLRKLAVLWSKKKNGKTKKIAKDLMESVGSVAQIAELGNSTYSRVYRLIHTPKKRTKENYERKLTDEQREEAIRIYYDDEVSYSIPEARYAHLRFMYHTVDETYRNHYIPKSGERKMARSTFAALKPNTVRTLTATPLRGCKCEYCQNLGLLRETLIGLGFQGIPKNHSASIEITWCPFRSSDNNECGEGDEEYTRSEEFPKKECVLGKCKDCGVEKYQQILAAKNSKLLKRTSRVKWEQWKTIITKRRKKTRRSIPKYIWGSIKTILKEYIEQVKDMSFHQFSKIWQLKQFNATMKNLRKGQVIFVHDFSQNILLYVQDEVSGAHWDHEQVAVHPTACFYICNNGFLVREEVIHLSNEKKHTHHAVDVFREKTIQHLRQKGVEINEIIEWTDNAASQYKSCGAFFVMSTFQTPTSHHFFGVKHGKSPSDRAGGTSSSSSEKVLNL
ncbi:MAG: hypothetical protein MJE68_34120, partial [Proteobacteria bacterium]|nr:hypothetical protein [Pseudomonadota bacterium]